MLFRLIAAAYERRSVAIASHSPFENGGTFLPDEPTAVSLLDRLYHHTHIITTSGRNYRLTHRTTHKEHDVAVPFVYWPITAIMLGRASPRSVEASSMRSGDAREAPEV